MTGWRVFVVTVWIHCFVLFEVLIAENSRLRREVGGETISWERDGLNEATVLLHPSLDVF